MPERAFRHTIRLGHLIAAAACTLVPGATPAVSQSFPTEDTVLQSIWAEGMDRSQVGALAQVLLDSIGPRLTGSPSQGAAARWVLERYRSWGIEARNEVYGTWPGWSRGITHLDLLEPRVRSLEASMLAWSPPTDGALDAPAMILPPLISPEAAARFFEEVAGALLLLSPAEPTCRPDAQWEEFATPTSLARLQDERTRTQAVWARALEGSGLTGAELIAGVERAGAAGVLTSNWPGGWGVTTMSQAFTSSIPSLVASCEDYGLLFRLAARNQNPVVRLQAESEFLGEVPVANIIAVVPGAELPNEYVVLSAHFDSWDAASGATDNGTGTLMILEAARILSLAYPRPRRTIVIAHWNGEEQGLNGSRAFAADHPEVVRGLQVLLNQDNGTGRITLVPMHGLLNAGDAFGRWLARIPEELTGGIEMVNPGLPGGGGSDYGSFLCSGAPAFQLGALDWEYSPYTWHTNRDTFDKVVLDDLSANATLTAMLAYLASEDPERVSRERADLGVDPSTGNARAWPSCLDANRRVRVR